MKDIIVKIGGKILEDEHNLLDTISQLKLILDDFINRIVIIPGGGSYANLVREIDNKMNIGDTLAHWMAILAMNTQGKKLINKFSEIEGVDYINILEESIQDKKIFLFLPYDYLQRNDELPHSWDVTSDSITIYLAHKFGLKKCYLIKDIDGIIDSNHNLIKQLTVDEYRRMKNSNALLKIKNDESPLKSSQPIDEYSLNLIERYKISCIILNGRTDRCTIWNYFNETEKNKTNSTKISFNSD